MFTLSVFNMVSITPINRLFLDITVYLNPNLLRKDLTGKIGISKANVSMLNRYYTLVSAMNWSYNKVLKYEIYFQEFYPNSENIPEYEVLEHHIHAYLQDLTILKNKLEVFLNSLRNDIKKVAKNKEEIVYHFNGLIKQLNQIFEEVLKHRNPHHHTWQRFLDSDIVDAEWLSTMLKYKDLSPDSFSPELLGEIAKRSKDSFETAKSKRITLAQKNNECITHFIEDLFLWLEVDTYKLLWIEQSMKEFIVPSPK